VYTTPFWNKEDYQNGTTVSLRISKPSGVDKLNGYRHTGHTSILSYESKWGIFRAGIWYDWAYTDRYSIPENIVTGVTTPPGTYHEHFISQTYQPFAEFECPSRRTRDRDPRSPAANCCQANHPYPVPRTLRVWRISPRSACPRSDSRSAAWPKRRVNRGQPFVIGGYTLGAKNFDAIMFGYCDGGKLMYGRTRSGFTPASRDQLFKRFKKLAAETSPFVNLPQGKGGRWGERLTAEKMTTMYPKHGRERPRRYSVVLCTMTSVLSARSPWQAVIALMCSSTNPPNPLKDFRPGTTTRFERKHGGGMAGIILGQACRWLLSTRSVAALAINIRMVGLSLAEGAAVLLRCEAGATRMRAFLRFRHKWSPSVFDG
jgi:hypothetical protein